jgi:hypothetical protein
MGEATLVSHMIGLRAWLGVDARDKSEEGVFESGCSEGLDDQREGWCR